MTNLFGVDSSLAGSQPGWPGSFLLSTCPPTGYSPLARSPPGPLYIGMDSAWLGGKESQAIYWILSPRRDSDWATHCDITSCGHKVCQRLIVFLSGFHTASFTVKFCCQGKYFAGRETIGRLFTANLLLEGHTLPSVARGFIGVKLGILCDLIF